MARYTRHWLHFTGIALLIGCAPEPPTAPVVNKPLATAAPRQQPALEPDPEALESNTAEQVEVTAEISAARPDDPDRILILARGGPLLLDVWLTVDRRPYGEELAALVERVLSAADTDGDGRPTWSEWRVNQVFLQGELANLDPGQQRRVRQWIKRFDENEDDQMQRAEAASWLGRGGGRSATALTLRSRRELVNAPSTHSRLWQLLDADGDRQLADDELRLAPQRLLRLDTNDDRIIARHELASLREQLDSQSGQRKRFADRSNRPAAIHLADRSDASQLDYVLSDLYAPRQQLGPASFSARASLFAALDVNQNRRLDSAELAALLDIEPHIKLSLDFSSAPMTGDPWTGDPAAGNAATGDTATGTAATVRPATQLTLLEHTQEVEQVIEATANRLVLMTDDTRLIVSAHDFSVRERTDQIAERSQLRLMIHDRGDALFDALDSNANGRLDEREIIAAAKRLRQRDADGNRQLDESELPVSMTMAFLRSEPAGERSFYVPGFDATSAWEPQTATPRWFRQADFNGDGDLSRGEFLGSAAQFAALDANQDGFISSDEAKDKRSTPRF